MSQPSSLKRSAAAVNDRRVPTPQPKPLNVWNQGGNLHHIVLGRRLINAQPQAHRGKLDHGEEVFGEFVVAGRDAAEVLQLGEEALDQVPLAIKPCAEIWLRAPVGLWRDIGECPLLAERRPDAIGIVSLVRQNDCSGTNMIEQIVSDLAIMGLPCSQAQPDREAFAVNDRMDFGREPASGATQAIISIPLFAVAAC